MKARIASLDVCRGFMLLSMTCNHLVLFPFIGIKWFRDSLMGAAYGSYGFLSNSEGFFFLAGFTAGIVYGRLVIEDRQMEMRNRIRKRIFQLYGIYCLLLVLLALAVSWNKQYWANWKELHSLIWVWIDQPGIHYFLDHPVKGSLLGFAFLYQLPFLDLFPLYIAFLALTPWLLNRLHRGQIFLALAVSIAFYIAAQYDPGIIEHLFASFLPVKFAWFRLSALQILFVAGLMFGFFYARGRLPNIHRTFIGVLLGLAALYGLFVLTQNNIQSPHSLGIQRLFIFSIKAYGVFLFSRFISFGPLAIIGRHSLSVFSYHIALTFFLIYFLSEISSLFFLWQSALLILAIFSVYIPAIILETKNRQKPNPLTVSHAASRDIVP